MTLPSPAAISCLIRDGALCAPPPCMLESNNLKSYTSRSIQQKLQKPLTIFIMTYSISDQLSLTQVFFPLSFKLSCSDEKYAIREVVNNILAFSLMTGYLAGLPFVSKYWSASVVSRWKTFPLLNKHALARHIMSLSLLFPHFCEA